MEKYTYMNTYDKTLIIYIIKEFELFPDYISNLFVEHLHFSNKE